MNPAPLKLTDEVIAAINGELDYTSKLMEAGRADKHDYGVEGQLVLLDVYVRKAQEAWVNNPGPIEALDIIRKVAAIACKALIRHGCPERYIFDPTKQN